MEMIEQELDALVTEAMDRAIERLQQLHDYAGRPTWDQVLREEMAVPITTLRAQLAEANTRADRAEAERAAQIEADAGICDDMDGGVFWYCDADDCAAAIRTQPHDRTALDRMLAESREKALREAAKLCAENEAGFQFCGKSGWTLSTKSEGAGSHPGDAYSAAILALIGEDR